MALSSSTRESRTMNTSRRMLGVLVMPVVALVALVPAPRSLFYQKRRPTRAGRIINRAWTCVAGAGLTPYSWPGQPRGGTVALETKGRRSGKWRSQVVTWVEHGGERYFVSMLGERSDWVRNARAAQGEAAIRHVHGGPFDWLKCRSRSAHPSCRPILGAHEWRHRSTWAASTSMLRLRSSRASRQTTRSFGS